MTWSYDQLQFSLGSDKIVQHLSDKINWLVKDFSGLI